MDLKDIRDGDVLRNTQTGKLYLMKDVVLGNLFLVDDQGEQAISLFKGQFELANDDEKSRFLQGRKKAISKGHEKKHGEYDEQETSVKFDEYVQALNKIHPVIAPQFLAFWSEVVVIIGGKPGQTWRMRNSPTFGLNPMIRVGSPATGNWVDGMYVSAEGREGTALNLAIMREYLPKDYDHLFPQKKTFHGKGDGIYLPYATMTAEILKPYLECVRVITSHRNSP